MPTKPPSDRTQEFIPKGVYPPQEGRRRTKGVPPVFNRSLSKFIPARPGFIGSLSAGDPLTNQKCETNPIYRTADLSPTRPTTQLHETNPITTGFGFPHNPNIQNEPNSNTPGAPPLPVSAKRTQFQPRRQIHELWNIRRGGPTTNYELLRETNPITVPPRTAGVSPAFPSPIAQNEPNPRTGTVPARRDAPTARNEPNSGVTDKILRTDD